MVRFCPACADVLCPAARVSVRASRHRIEDGVVIILQSRLAFSGAKSRTLTDKGMHPSR